MRGLGVWLCRLLGCFRGIGRETYVGCSTWGGGEVPAWHHGLSSAFVQVAGFFCARRLERVSDDLPSDLPRLEVLRTWHAMWLARIDDKIRQVRVVEEQRARAAEAREVRAPEWLVEYGLNRDALPVAVHAGDCRMVGKRAKGVDAEVARRALVEGVEACTHCRPDTHLGFLEG